MQIGGSSDKHADKHANPTELAEKKQEVVLIYLYYSCAGDQEAAWLTLDGYLLIVAAAASSGCARSMSTCLWTLGMQTVRRGCRS